MHSSYNDGLGFFKGFPAENTCAIYILFQLALVAVAVIVLRSINTDSHFKGLSSAAEM